MEKKYIAFLLKSGFTLDEIINLDTNTESETNTNTETENNTNTETENNTNTETENNANTETENNTNTEPDTIDSLKTDISSLREEITKLRKITQDTNRKNAVIDDVNANQLTLEDKVNKLLEEVG